LSLINELYKSKNQTLKRLVSPAYYYKLFLITTRLDSINLLVREYIPVVNKSNPYETKVDLYTILIVKRLQSLKIVPTETIHSILSVSIINLSKIKEIDYKSSIDRSILEMRTWCRLMLSNLYYLDYVVTRESNQNLLMKAYDYSCDQNDLIYIHRFTPLTRLFSGSEQLGFEGEYAKYLISKGETKQALEVLTKRAILVPTNKNLSALRNFYIDNNTAKEFKEYWNENLNAFYKPSKDLSVKTIDYKKLKISDFKGNWLYIDVWGNWCAPCRNDLPNLQKFYEETLQDSNCAIKILTLSYSSTNVKEFLNEHNYTFPVAEIDRYETGILNVYYYPTRFLITPTGNLIRIPFAYSWTELVRNFTLMTSGI
jgi:thiol-disulfide isomerase/thioredoxin